jgi:hypothetical protein
MFHVNFTRLGVVPQVLPALFRILWQNLGVRKKPVHGSSRVTVNSATNAHLPIFYLVNPWLWIGKTRKLHNSPLVVATRTEMKGPNGAGMGKAVEAGETQNVMDMVHPTLLLAQALQATGILFSQAALQRQLGSRLPPTSLVAL